MIICNGNKIHNLEYDSIQHWFHLNLHAHVGTFLDIRAQKLNYFSAQVT